MVARKRWKIRFYKDLDTGEIPARRWLLELEQSNPMKARAAIQAIERILKANGVDVCATEWGKNLGDGLYEFRIRHPDTVIVNMFATEQELQQRQQHEGENERVSTPPAGHEKVLLRIFFTTYGEQVILLCSGYDKGRDPSPKRQAAEIKRARGMAAAAHANRRARQKAEGGSP